MNPLQACPPQTSRTSAPPLAPVSDSVVIGPLPASEFTPAILTRSQAVDLLFKEALKVDLDLVMPRGNPLGSSCPLIASGFVLQVCNGYRPGKVWDFLHFLLCLSAFVEVKVLRIREQTNQDPVERVGRFWVPPAYVIRLLSNLDEYGVVRLLYLLSGLKEEKRWLFRPLIRLNFHHYEVLRGLVSPPGQG